MKQRSVTPLHVGGHLTRLIEERGTTADQLSKATGLTFDLITYLLAGEQILTADVAIALAEVFEMSPLIWLDLQRSYYLSARDMEEVGRLVTA